MWCEGLEAQEEAGDAETLTPLPPGSLYKHVINALLCVRHHPEGARNTHPQNLQRQVGKLNKQTNKKNN